MSRPNPRHPSSVSAAEIGAPSPGARLPYLAGLDGLRALAVLSVLAFHGDLSFAPGGFLGVSSFFTLSGYLIASLLIAEHEATGRIALPAFWVRRFRRLMPAALTALLGVALFGATLADEIQRHRLLGEGLAALFYSANWYFHLVGRSYLDLFVDPSPVMHFWSLSIEEQFYVLFPLLVVGVLVVGKGGRRSLALVFAAAGVASIVLNVVLYQPGGDPSRVYFGTDTRALELLVGALLATARRPRGFSVEAEGAPGAGVDLMGWLGLAGLVAGVGMLEATDPWIHPWALLGNAVATALVIAAVAGGWRRTNILASRPMVWLGRISYGAYLYHWPIDLWLSPERTGMDGLVLFGVRLTLTVALAALSYTWIEAPIRHGGRLPGWRLGGAALPAVVVVALALVAATHGATRPLLLDAPPKPEDYAAPLAPGAPRILVVGDSVAQTLASGLIGWSRETGLAAVESAASINCGVARGGVRRSLFTGQWVDDPCGRWEGRFGAALADSPPDVVVVSSVLFDTRDRPIDGRMVEPGMPAFDQWLLDEYAAAVDLLSGRGRAPVVWLTAPCASPSAMRRIANRSGLDVERRLHLNRVLLPRLAERMGGLVSIADLDARVCPDGVFSEALGDVDRARPDGLHFSYPGARAVADWLGPLLVEIAESSGGEARPDAGTPR